MRLRSTPGWKACPRDRPASADDELVHEITVVHLASGGTCGVPRVHAELGGNRKRVERIMREALTCPLPSLERQSVASMPASTHLDLREEADAARSPCSRVGNSLWAPASCLVGPWVVELQIAHRKRWGLAPAHSCTGEAVREVSNPWVIDQVAGALVLVLLEEDHPFGRLVVGAGETRAAAVFVRQRRVGVARSLHDAPQQTVAVRSGPR